MNEDIILKLKNKEYKAAQGIFLANIKELLNMPDRQFDGFLNQLKHRTKDIDPKNEEMIFAEIIYYILERTNLEDNSKLVDFCLETARILIPNHLNSYDDFETNVRKFKQLYSIKNVKNIFEDEILLNIFMGSPFVINFLTRAVENLEFDETHAPILPKKEKRIYQNSSTDIPYRTPLRNMIKQEHHFFNSGTASTPATRNIFHERLNKKISTIRPDNIDILTSKYFMPINLFLKKRESSAIDPNEISIYRKGICEYSYALLPMEHSNHAVLTINLVNNKTNTCEAIFFVNSIQQDNEEKYKDAATGYNSDIIFIDVPFSLQNIVLGKGVTDENCVIYRNDFSAAFIEMLSKEHDIRSRIESDMIKDPEASKKMGQDIAELMKKYLPMYYQHDQSSDTYVQRNAKDVIQYFQKVRWEIGSEDLKNHLPNRIRNKLK